ncbi:MAG: RNA polymerase sigma factor [Crocinitomicaceae bacterium]
MVLLSELIGFKTVNLSIQKIVESSNRAVVSVLNLKNYFQLAQKLVDTLNFQSLYNEHKNLVFNLALHYVQNTEEAEEITQDVFLKVYEKMNRFKEESSLKTWIYRITINTSLDYIKAKKRNKRGFFLSAIRLDEPTSRVDATNFDHPGVLLENKEATKEIFDAINQLPDDQKTVVLLLRIEHHSMAEVAVIMNKTNKAIESLFQRAKSNLKIILKQNEGK